ncbi:MAG: antibiotic biosynthesis monooxygenase [Pyrinomonadaceae bacterium]|jgi:quinol monooxygenase YgiN|nr:antibiotic biosynthesis monooxygenase [Pyrinomonadaceae bacterium]
MSDLYLTARLKVKADKVSELKSAALAIVEPSRAESGCISYNVHQSVEDETVFVWRECWTSKADLDEHFEMDYVKGFFAIVGEVAEEPPQITLTNLIS